MKWEYMRINRIWGDEVKLNEAGEKGWELVNFTEDGTAILKRNNNHLLYGT